MLKNDVKGAPATVAKVGMKVGKAGVDAGMKLGKAGIDAGKAGIEEGVRLGAQGADYARVTGANLNRRYNELTSRRRRPDVETAGEDQVASTGNTRNTGEAIPMGVIE